ncbi:hypothetical protein [Nitrosomonas sp. Is37]|uniref:GAP1-N1 domain-containing protein n=1 Tax=Nitrosomonas sp. Is37 TaxID=3080535 RepID=UPI00294B8CFD|nr:hypothetical protein [Nitrosomonas sp. Is37]MDV6344771.1 hypothetical protein [Nitrosomonas sp. Is37]
MNYPLRARYGAKDNRHDLLDWQGQPAELPPELFGLTDKPPGHLKPSDNWWPSVGCGTVGNWWALWWTVPDEAAKRGGMVRSEVALWPVAEIGKVDDLRPVLTALSGAPNIPTALPEILQAIAETLISSESNYPIVLPAIYDWPSLLADLWMRLWPQARQNFSARMAVVPPQGGESISPPLLFCIPSQRLSEWSTHPVIRPELTSDNRAATWLMGKDDTTFQEILELCGYPENLKGLGKIARAAKHLDELRSDSRRDNALTLLRTLETLMPNPDAGIGLKSEALRALKQDFQFASLQFVLSLRNLNLGFLPSNIDLDEELDAWLNDHVFALPHKEGEKLLSGLANNQAESWWQTSVRNTLSRNFTAPAQQWARLAFHWLTQSDCSEILKTLLPVGNAVEDRLLNITTDVTLTSTELQQLQKETQDREWPRLHAWAVMRAFLPAEAFRLQRQFPKNAYLGLHYLVEHLPGQDVIDEVIARGDSQLITLIAQRTKQEPALLNTLDVSNEVWLSLWAKHIAAGGVHWPPNADHKILGSKLLEVILSEKTELSGLIKPLANDLAEIAFQHPERANLWEILKPDSRAALLPVVADRWILTCETKQTINPPESQLAQEVSKKLHSSRCSVKVFVLLIPTNAILTEQDLIGCFANSNETDWDMSLADTIGKYINVRKWESAAETLYRMFDSRKTSELQFALDICKDQLSILKKCLFNITRKLQTSGAIRDGNNLVLAIADLGANLAPDRLDYLWERAGGNRKDLKAEGAHSSRWLEAVKMAENGKIKKGACAIVEELKKEYPNHSDLIKLSSICFQRLEK